MGFFVVGCLISQHYASVSLRRICVDSYMCCHTEISTADQACYITQSLYGDTWRASPSSDPITPVRVATGVNGMNGPGQIFLWGKWDSILGLLLPATTSQL